ncbi:MAG: hypothetical protein LW817_07690 [Candidatus Caenarcaniphilales bacterium]|nr:hypothetical protein [Candidatus Caenarcaniphilales bacterium]
MRVLIIGSGAAAHAIAWKLLSSEKSKNHLELIVAPGNKVLNGFAECLDIDTRDVNRILDISIARKINLTIVLDESLFATNIVEIFQEAGKLIFAPGFQSSLITRSRSLAKEFFIDNHIPSIKSVIFDDANIALAYLSSAQYPLRLLSDRVESNSKALFVNSFDEVQACIGEFFKQKFLSQEKNKIIIEEQINKNIFSIATVCDGFRALSLSPVQAYKSLNLQEDNGAYAPTALINDRTMAIIRKEIINPVMAALEKNNAPYTGFLCFDISLNPNPQLIQIRSNLCDSEAQVMLPLLDEDLYELLQAAANHDLGHYKDGLHKFVGSALAVNINSSAPANPNLINEIQAILEDINHSFSGINLVYYGTKLDENQQVIKEETFGITAVAETLVEAQILAYKITEAIDIPNKEYEKQIGDHGLVS